MDVTLDEVKAYCQQFREGQAYRTQAEKYLAWILNQYLGFQEILQSRDATVIRLIEEKGKVRAELSARIKELEDELDGRTKRT